MFHTFDGESNYLYKIKAYRPWINKREVFYTIPAVIWLILNVFFVYLGISLADKLNPFPYLPYDIKFDLYDPFFVVLTRAFKQTSLPPNISDILVGIAFGLVVLRILLAGRKTLLLARRAAYLIGFLYLLRIPFMLMTFFPNPLHQCVPQVNNDIALNAIQLMTQQKPSCGDLMFSGHTVMFMISCLIWVNYPIFKNKYINFTISIMFIIYTLLCIISLIASSYHYTIDVSVSVFIDLTVWKVYHFVVTSNYFDNYLAKFLLYIDQEHYLLSISSPSVTMQYNDSFA